MSFGQQGAAAVLRHRSCCHLGPTRARGLTEDGIVDRAHAHQTRHFFGDLQRTSFLPDQLLHYIEVPASAAPGHMW